MKNTAYSSFLTSALVVLVNLMPLPAMASEDKLYDYLIRFGTALDAFQLRRYPEAEAMASKLYDDACREGLDKPSASKVFHSSSGLDKVTPLLRVPVKYGTVYQRLFIEIRKLRGSTQSAAGKYALAGKELQSIVDQYPDFVDCRTALSIHYRRLKDYDKALQELDKAAQKNPRLISIFYSRVLIYREMGNREQEQKAVVEYNRLRVAQENEVGDFIRGTSAGADIKADEKKAEHMIAAHPTQSSPIAVYADIISGDRLEDARKYASIAIAVGSQQKFGYISRSDINLDLNLFREAEADASKAIEIDPKNLDTRITRALAYINSNRLNEALSDLNFAITHVPSWATPYSYRAAVYIEQGEYKEALEDARKAVRIDTEDPLGFNILGLCYCRLKMYPSAEVAFEEMVRLERNGPGFAGPLARLNLGRAYHYQNKEELAAKEYDKTLIAAPDFPEITFQKSATATRFGFRDQEVKIALLTGVLPSLPFVQMHCIEDSSALYSRKLQLVPRSSLSRLQRGLQFACMNKTEDAAKDLERFVESGKQDRDKAILMAFLCQSRAGHEEKAKAALRANLANLHDPSLSSLARFFLGETSEAQVSKPTGSITRDTIVHSNLGYYYLTKGDRSKAKPHLEWALLKGDRKAPEFILALTELERMCGRRSSVNLL